MKYLFTLLLTTLLVTNIQAQQVIPAEKFGNNGISLTEEDNEVINVRQMLIQPENKLLIAIATNDNEAYSPGINLRRLKINGILDSSFGVNGIVNVRSANYSQRYGGKIGLQHDGKIIVLSVDAERHFDSRPDTVWLERFLPDGKKDSSFGKNGGVFITDSTGENNWAASGLQVRGDDKILLIASYNTYNYTSSLRRYLPDGKPDNSFGVNGIVNSTSIYDKNIYQLLLLPGNKMVAVSSYTTAPNVYTNCIIKYNENGTIDSSVIPGGIVKVANSFSSSRTDAGLQLQHDGKLLLYTSDNSNNTIYRFENNGMPDVAFGDNGKVTAISGSAYYSTYNIDIQADSKIVINLKSSNQLARYNVNGSIDSTFGINGVLTVPGILSNNIFIIEKNKLIVAGDAFNNRIGAIEVAVYKPCNTCKAINTTNTNSIVYRNNSFKIFPNPAKNILQVQTTTKNFITITNTSGKVVLAKTINNSDIINLTNLPSGMYYVKNINTGETQKVIVIK